MNINLLIFISIFCWGIGDIFYKAATATINPFAMFGFITIVYVIAVPIVLFVSNTKIQESHFQGIVYTLIGGLLIFIGTISFLSALKRGDASQIVSVTSLYPVVTLIFSYLFLNEVMNLKKIIGCGLAVVAMFLLSN